MLDAFGERGGAASVPAGPRVLGADRRRRRCAIAHDQWRTNVFDPPMCWDLETPEAVRRGGAACAARGRGVEGARRRPTCSGTSRGCRSSRRSASTTSRCTTSARTCDAFIDAFGEHVLPAAAMSIKATSDLWWKNARLLLPRRRDVPRLQRRRLRRPARADRARRLPRRPRHQLPVADAVLPVAQPRRRLRHHRLLRRRPALGTLGDFTELVRTCRDRGIRVIADFVMNHTSDQHPWFQAARSGPRLAVPRLLRLERREAGGEARRRRLPRPGELELGLRPQGEGVLPAQVLFAPAGPQPGQSRGPRRARTGDGVLARSRA